MLTEDVFVAAARLCPFHQPTALVELCSMDVSISPEVLGIPIPAPDFRDRLLAALEAERVPVTLWHLTPLPCFPIFEEMGKRDDKRSRQEAADFPVAQRLLDTSFVICDEEHPIYAQSMDLLEYYVQALNKVKP